MNKKTFDEASREYLDFSKDTDGAEIFAILKDYLSLLFEDPEEEILIEDFTAYEADDFINFFLEDNFEDKELEEVRSKSIKTLKGFSKFLDNKKYVHKEAIEEWKEVLNL